MSAWLVTATTAVANPTKSILIVRIIINFLPDYSTLIAPQGHYGSGNIFCATLTFFFGAFMTKVYLDFLAIYKEE